ncbi:MAG: DUF4870 domain-containing protein [Ktedonobacterales bacterium]
MAKESSTDLSVPHTLLSYGYDPRRLTLLDRLIAASAHLAILLSVPGMVYAAFLWLALRRRAPFIARHAREGVLWQVVTNIALVLSLVVLFLVAFFSFGTTLNASGSNAGESVVGLFGSLLGLFVVLILGLTVAVGAAVIGAIYALAGRPFRYPLFNRRRRQD